MSYQTVICAPTEIDAVAFRLRREGWEVRDCLSIQKEGGPTLALLIRRPMATTVHENVVRNGSGALNIDGSRISTLDSLGGGATNPEGDGVVDKGGFDRPWMSDPDKRKAFSERMVKSVAKAEALGRFPANLILSHTPECVQVGTKKMGVTGGGPVKGGEGYAKGGYEHGQKDSRPAFKGYTEDGTETVEAWECSEECPVRQLGGQAGELKSGSRKEGIPKVFQGDVTYGDEWETSLPALRGDKGGASRFFYNATSPDDLTDYLRGLTRRDT